MNIDHDRLERLAIELCESRMGKGHWNKPGTRKTHWRKRALPLAAIVEQTTPYQRTKDALANIMGGRW